MKSSWDDKDGEPFKLTDLFFILIEDKHRLYPFTDSTAVTVSMFSRPTFELYCLYVSINVMS